MLDKLCVYLRRSTDSSVGAQVIPAFETGEYRGPGGRKGGREKTTQRRIRWVGGRRWRIKEQNLVKEWNDESTGLWNG